MSTAALPQLVYVVRLWQSGSPHQLVWRSYVQNPLTGERHIFTDLNDLFAFIEEQTQAGPSARPIAPAADQPDQTC